MTSSGSKTCLYVSESKLWPHPGDSLMTPSQPELVCQAMGLEVAEITSEEERIALQEMTSRFWVQVILFEIDCAIFYTNLHKLFCHLISWTSWVNSGELMNNCWISCQVRADMKKVYNNLIIINLYIHK